MPYVCQAARMIVEPLDKGLTRLTLHFGFAEAPDVPAALEAHRAEFPIDIPETSFFLGRETPVPTVRPDLPPWREKLYGFMTRNAVSASSYFQIPPKRVVELGTQVEL
jgi:KUP system potassium uptake protein